jgi:DNA polymerase III alpha subunit
VEYGMIAYYTMFLKIYYPIEFYWALLRSEHDRQRVQQFAKDAKKHDIKLLPPHVSTSSTHFVIDRESNAIRVSLVDIKGVGDAASASIMENQPFTDFADFISRVERRKCHKGVVLALAKAGALEGMLPSTKWFVDNIETIWKTLTKGKGGIEAVKHVFEEAKDADEYSEEDKVLMSSSVNPLAFGKHPIDAYGTFMRKNVKAPIVSMSDDGFFKDHDNKGCFIAGVIVEVRYNQIGDFHSGEPPPEAERHRMFWGARYANVNIEDAGGKQNRTKFDIDIFDRERPLIDSGIGTPLIAHVMANAKFENLRAQFAVSLVELRKKIREGQKLNVWERIVTGDHPAKSYPWKEGTAKAKIRNEVFKHSKGGGPFVGVVTHVRLKYDRKDNLMAFFGMIGGDMTYIDVVAFASVWPDVMDVIKPGRLLKVDLEKHPDQYRGWSYFCGYRVKWLKKSKAESSLGAAA